jgi:hypothetical protein
MRFVLFPGSRSYLLKSDIDAGSLTAGAVRGHRLHKFGDRENPRLYHDVIPRKALRLSCGLLEETVSCQGVVSEAMSMSGAPEC